MPPRGRPGAPVLPHPAYGVPPARLSVKIGSVGASLVEDLRLPTSRRTRNTTLGGTYPWKPYGPSCRLVPRAHSGIRGCRYTSPYSVWYIPNVGSHTSGVRDRTGPGGVMGTIGRGPYRSQDPSYANRVRYSRSLRCLGQ